MNLKQSKIYNLKRGNEDIILSDGRRQDVLIILDDIAYQNVKIEETALGVGVVKWFGNVMEYSQLINKKILQR